MEKERLKIQEELKITENKDQEETGRAQLSSRSWKTVGKGEDRQQYSEKFGGVGKWKDSYLEFLREGVHKVISEHKQGMWLRLK